MQGGGVGALIIVIFFRAEREDSPRGFFARAGEVAFVRLRGGELAEVAIA